MEVLAEVPEQKLACAGSYEIISVLADILRNPIRLRILELLNGERHLAEIARKLHISDQDMGFHMRFIRKLPERFLKTKRVDGRKVYLRCAIDVSKIYFAHFE